MRMPHWPSVPWNKKGRDNLAEMQELLEALGTPHLRVPPVIHVAGTNGKGSSVAMLKAIFEAASYKVHTYTSPHLVDFNERIVLAGEKISDQYLFDICERTRLAAEKIGLEPRFFDAVTAAAFLAFSEVEADILILETGLGGRLDATNVIEKPLLTLITPISYDHMDILGATLPLIAAEKAGIIKPSVPCVISAQVEEVYPVFFAKCVELSAPVMAYGYDFALSKTDNGFAYLSETCAVNGEIMKSKTQGVNLPSPALRGDHQLINAASVVAAVALLNKQFNISLAQIASGLVNTQWAARIQKIDNYKYRGQPVDIWLDGAHNASGAQVLAEWIKDNVQQPVYLILGVTKNRNVESFCSYFKGIISGGYAVKVLSEPSSYDAETLATRASSTGTKFLPADSIEDAINEIIEIADKEQSRITIVICGSLFLAADFLKLNNLSKF